MNQRILLHLRRETLGRLRSRQVGRRGTKRGREPVPRSTPISPNHQLFTSSPWPHHRVPHLYIQASAGTQFVFLSFCTKHRPVAQNSRDVGANRLRRSRGRGTSASSRQGLGHQSSSSSCHALHYLILLSIGNSCRPLVGHHLMDAFSGTLIQRARSFCDNTQPPTPCRIRQDTGKH